MIMSHGMMKKNIPSDKCLENIQERINILKEKFEGKFPDNFEIVPVCAVHNYGIENLRKIITTK